MSQRLVNKLKTTMSVISDRPKVFAGNWQIHDNLIVIFEDLYIIKKGRFEIVNVISLKLDMSKAFDRLNSRFILEVMRKCGILKDR